MELERCTWLEVEEYLQENQQILIPIGSTEQHGPTGMIGTDSLSAKAIAQRVSETLGVMMAPVISFGMATHHMGFCGTMTLQPETLVQVIRDVVQSLAHHGFDDFVFINGHGGNVASLKTAFKQLDHNCRFYNWYMGPKTTTLRKEFYGDQEGFHATPSEIAVIQYLEPSTIREASTLNPVTAPAQKYNGPDELRKFHPDGRIGANVSLADPAQGQQLFETAVSDLIEVLTSQKG